jgi:hypothetical protein
MVSHHLKQPGKQQRNYVQANACAKFTDWMIGVVALSLLQSIIVFCEGIWHYWTWHYGFGQIFFICPPRMDNLAGYFQMKKVL